MKLKIQNQKIIKSKPKSKQITFAVILVLLLYLIISNLKCRPIISGDTLVKLQSGILERREDITEFNVPEGIKYIGAFAFYGCTSLENVTLPSTVESIRWKAFCNCINLEEINLPDGLEVIENGAFLNCESIKKIKLPQKLTIIEDNTFSDCTSLESIDFPQNLDEIGVSAFSNCESLKEVNLPDEISNIKYDAFQGCTNLEKVKLSKNIKSVSKGIFEGTAFIDKIKADENGCIYWENVLLRCLPLKEYIEIKGNTRVIAGGAFEDNKIIKKVSLPNELIGISTSAFGNCENLEDMNLPSSIERIGIESFENTKYLNNLPTDDYGCRYVGSLLLAYADKGVDKIKIKDGTKLIAGNTFHDAKSIKEVYIPRSVQYIGDQAFSFCSNIEKVEFEEDSKLESIERYVFQNCSSLRNINLPKNLKKILHWTFVLCDFKTIRIPENVEYIDVWAIAECPSLKRIELPKSLEGKYYWISDRPKPEFVFY